MLRVSLTSFLSPLSYSFGGGGEGGGIFSLKSLNSLISSESSHHRSQGRRTGNESGGQNKGMSAVEAGGKEMAIIIDGKSLQFVLNSYAKYFLQLTDHCKTVICCRVTPMQKALVVRMVKSLRGVTTLAIGDGGNDVSMIQVSPKYHNKAACPQKLLGNWRQAARRSGMRCFHRGSQKFSSVTRLALTKGIRVLLYMCLP